MALSCVRTRDGVALLALADRAKVCKVDARVLAYHQRLGFVPHHCDIDDGEGRVREGEGVLA